MPRITLLLLLLVLSPSLCYSQTYRMMRWNRDLMVHAGTGIASYYGEMVDQGDIIRPRLNLTIGAEHYLSPFFSARVGLSWFQLEARDTDANPSDSRRTRNLSFKSNNIELTATGVVSLFHQGLKFYDRVKINLYAFAGIGVLYFNPKAKYNGQWHELQPLQTEGRHYSLVQPVIPFGLGARIKLSHYMNLLVEGGYRATFTDYLDDVSSNHYPDPASLKSDLSRALSDRRAELGGDWRPMVGVRGNPTRDDGYFIASISLQYYLPMELDKNARKKAYYRGIEYNRQGNPKQVPGR
jgi:hypothetical protein